MAKDQLQDLREIFQSLDNAGLQLQLSKCDIAFSSIRYLGHITNGQAIRPNPDNIRAVRDTKTPTNRKQVRSSWISAVTTEGSSDFACIAQPLNDLTRLDIMFTWNKARQEAFEILKIWLTSDPVHRLFNPDLLIEIHIEACGSGIGTVLVQKDGKEELSSDTQVGTSTRQR